MTPRSLTAPADAEARTLASRSNGPVNELTEFLKPEVVLDSDRERKRVQAAPAGERFGGAEAAFIAAKAVLVSFEVVLLVAIEEARDVLSWVVKTKSF